MCGIYGFSSLTRATRRMIPILAVEMESRGRDSWGATDGEHVHKSLGPITGSFWQHGAAAIAPWTRGIFHTRAASTGAVTLENQHPFRFDATFPDGTPLRTIIGIHNGIVANHEELNDRYPTRKFDCDSPHIYAAFAYDTPTREIHGYGNLAWYEYDAATPDGVLRLLRFNNDALYVVRLTSGEVAFASTLESLRRAAWVANNSVDTVIHLEPEVKYTVVPVPGGPVEVRKDDNRTVFGNRYASSTYIPSQMYDAAWLARQRSYTSVSKPYRTPSAIPMSDSRDSNTCGVMNCSNRTAKKRKKNLICTECLMKILSDLHITSKENPDDDPNDSSSTHGTGSVTGGASAPVPADYVAT